MRPPRPLLAERRRLQAWIPRRSPKAIPYSQNLSFGLWAPDQPAAPPKQLQQMTAAVVMFSQAVALLIE
jgi:hypothetical protein